MCPAQQDGDRIAGGAFPSSLHLAGRALPCSLTSPTSLGLDDWHRHLSSSQLILLVLVVLVRLGSSYLRLVHWHRHLSHRSFSRFWSAWPPGELWLLYRSTSARGPWVESVSPCGWGEKVWCWFPACGDDGDLRMVLGHPSPGLMPVVRKASFRSTCTRCWLTGS